MAQFDFYKQLYERDKHNISEETVGSFLSDLDIPCISELFKESCEVKRIIIDCDEIIKTFQNGKSPGNDGITCEFYKEFWTFLRPVLVECFNDSFQLDRLPTSQTQAVITLIEKKDVDRALLKNWRPISYKIYI